MLPSKNYNLILPYTTYRKLKDISARKEIPIAEIVRQGIDLVLEGKGKSEGCNDGQAKNSQ